MGAATLPAEIVNSNNRIIRWFIPVVLSAVGVSSAARGSSHPDGIVSPMRPCECGRSGPNKPATREWTIDTRRPLHVRVNEYTSAAQDGTSLDRGALGATVTVWHSRRQESGTYGIYARIIDPAGNPASAEIHVNAYERNMQTNPAVAIAPTGEIWFAWQSFEQDGDQNGIIARRFDGEGRAASDETTVNRTTIGNQSRPAIAARPDGGAVVVWTSAENESLPRRIMVRVISADGKSGGDDIPVDGANAWHDDVASVATDRNGGFLVVWARSELNGRPTAIVARRFDRDARPRGHEFMIQPPDGRMPIEPSLAMRPDGSYACAWATAEIDGYEIYVRSFDAHDRAANAWRVDRGVAGHIGATTIATRPDGDVAVAWNTWTPAADTTEIYARAFSSAGRPRGRPIHVSAGAPAGDHELRAATGAKRAHFDDQGRLTLAWSGAADDTDKSAAVVSVAEFDPDPTAGSDPATVTCGIQAGRPIASAAGDSILQSQTLELQDVATPTIRSPSPHEPPVFDPDRIAPDDADADPAAAAGQPTGTTDFGFVGITDTGWNPPDPHIAVGLNHIVLITNGKIMFRDKNGTLTFQDQLENNFGFWGELGATNQVFDPEVLHDPHSGRFMALANERTQPNGTGESYFLLAVSDDADPNGAWHKYRIDVTPIINGTGQGSIDSPNIAVDADAVYLSADFTGLNSHLMLFMDKTPLLNGDAAVYNYNLFSGTKAWALPVMHDPADAMYAIEAIVAGSFNNTFIRVHAVTDPLGKPQPHEINVNTAAYRIPERPLQMGTNTRITTFDARFWSCVYRNGSIWAAHHITRHSATGDPRVLVRWYQIATNGWPTVEAAAPSVVQWGEIDAGPSVRTFFPAIGVDPDDNLGLVFSRVSPTEFISIGRTGRLAADAPGTTRPMTIVQTSTMPESEFGGRWGDYGGIVVDPSDDRTFWYHHEYRTTGWRTWVGTFSLADADPPMLSSADPFDGYIDPRQESSNGINLDRGIDRVTLNFSERVVAPTGPLTAAAFDLDVTGGNAPAIQSIDVSAMPTVEITLSGPIAVDQYTTIHADVMDLSGNLANVSVQYGFLPCDINQDGMVTPSDMIRFRQYYAGTVPPPPAGLAPFMDLDRNQFVQPADLIRLRQLLSGTAPATRPWLGESLP